METAPSEHHKFFIEQQMKNLAVYDSMRPAGHVYEFDLHSKRVATNISLLGKACGYDDNACTALYWATLPHDIGKTMLPAKIWDMDEKPDETQKRERRSHTWRGVQIVRETFGHECDTDPFLRLMIDIMENHHETMDGKGFLGKSGEQLSTEVRMACICDAFDGWSTARPHFHERDISAKGVIHRMKTEKAGQFDEYLLKKFETIVVKE